MRVVVNHSESRRVVQVEEGWCETTLRESIAAKFPECDVSEVLIQVSPWYCLGRKNSRGQKVWFPRISTRSQSCPRIFSLHYPGKLYSEAARQLVWHHKQLKDQGSFGTGYDSWQRALRNKTKHQRRKLASNGIVLQNRQKFTPKRIVSGVPCCTSVRVARDIIPPDASAEDEHSLHGLLEWMNKELKRPLADMEKMQDAMQRTYASRRKFVCTEDPPASRIWELYPALLKKEQIFAEFLRITAVNAKHKFYEVVALHWLSVVTLTSSKPNRPEVLGVIMDELSKAEGEKQEGLQCLAFLVGVPQLLKENHCSFLRDDKEDHVQPAFPVMQVRGGASSSPLTVVLEDCSFEVTDIVAGIALILALYWVHDISSVQKHPGHLL
ncbi:uncharacterized protein ISCGN_002170 [Ixodes scapularis]